MNPVLFTESVECWAALRTAGHWEKKLAGLLAEAGVPVFLPMMSRLTGYSGKRRVARVPIFGGYVFCSESDFLGNKALTPGTRAKVAQILRPSDPTQLRSELKNIAELLTDRELVQERLSGRVGDLVRITGGSLAGYRGKIVRVSPNRWQVVLEVSFLGSRLEIEVDERTIDRTGV